MPEDAILPELKPLHAPNTLYNFPTGILHNYQLLKKLIFGVTVSKNHGYAIIPAPSTDAIDASQLRRERIGELLAHYWNYDDKDGPLKAIITADSEFVATLVREFERLLIDPAAKCLT